MNTFKYYLKLARPHHSLKNLFIVPGFLIAYLIFLPQETISHLSMIFCIGLISAFFICYANYIINEWLDRHFDQFHPVKKNRPSVVHQLQGKYIFLEYILFAFAGLSIAAFISIPYLMTSSMLLVSGLIYNVEPLRTKNYAYFDVLTESINNPIRLLLGWFMISSASFPPLSLLLSYWMGGAFLMGVKRYSEFQFINEPALASLYRASFRRYSSEKLLVSSLFYAVSAAFFGGIFLAQYKTELILLFPLYAMIFAWYLYIGFKPNSIAQSPEYIYKERLFLWFICLVIILSMLVLFIHIPLSEALLHHG